MGALRRWFAVLVAAAALVASRGAVAGGLFEVVGGIGPQGYPRGAVPVGMGGNWSPWLPRVATRACGEAVAGAVAWRVVETFRNDRAAAVDAAYRAVLPAGAVVAALTARVEGGRDVAAYPSGASGVAGWVPFTWSDGAASPRRGAPVVDLPIRGIPPGATVEIELGVALATNDDGDVREAIVPAVDASASDSDVRLRVEAGAPVGTVDGPSRDATFTREGASAFVAYFRGPAPSRDLRFRWRVAPLELAAAVFAHRPPGVDGYVAIALTPPIDPPASEVAPREVLLVLETGAAPYLSLATAASRVLPTLRPADTFQIAVRHGDPPLFREAPVAATPENVERARAYLEGLELVRRDRVAIAAASRRVDEALHARPDPARAREVLRYEDCATARLPRASGAAGEFDGHVRVGGSASFLPVDEVERVAQRLPQDPGPDRLAVEVGDRAARSIGGRYLTGLSIDWGGDDVREVAPGRLRDVRVGGTVMAVGRYLRSGPRTITVRGRVGGRPYERRITVDLPALEASRAPLANHWALARIAELSEGGAVAPGLIDDERDGLGTLRHALAVQLSFEHGLGTRLTPLVVVDPGPARAPEPPLDEGAHYDMTFVTEEPVGGSQLTVLRPTPVVLTASDGFWEPLSNGAECHVAVPRRPWRSCAGCSVPDGRSGRGAVAVALVALTACAARRRRR